ncbi:RNA methyltransferase [Litoribacter alkaliphilus]|uniref:RNA methyltransferase n=1 Tax=Litoribacter ruber TaxID=702568 RepID=A0AAP2CER7_9BACT|nr:RNA methyltransferase [Litoribacter alkaliphilus]MBS9523168.1 RNA methyltransferase [Litoribacter alkaliphilus]
MLSKNTVKFIKSLQQKKFRKQENSFFVEGAKNVTELLRSEYEITHLLFTKSFEQENISLIKRCGAEKFEVTPKVLESAGSFQSNDAALAVAKIKENRPLKLESSELILALDDVRDPGNLGTIIRIADWYGLKKIICSPQCADIYNPKVLNSSMGSFTRMDYYYTDLELFLQDCGKPIFGTFLGGDNIYDSDLPADGVIVMGNESKGISPEVEKLVTHKLTIPQFGQAESLNVAIATAVICDNFRRAQWK